MILHIGKKELSEMESHYPLSLLVTITTIVTAFVDLQMNVIYYGDSLGWSSPQNLVCLVKEYTKYISNKECTNNFRIIHYHKPTEEKIYHSCSECTGIYPLQSDTYTCGIIVIVMPALFGWTENFTQLAEFSYLASPWIYNKLLRFVVISWFVRGKTDCGLLQIEIVHDGDIV